MGFPHAFHITFGTYGARLHGSMRPFIDMDHNEYGAPLPPPDPAREQAARDRMDCPAVPVREVVDAVFDKHPLL
jgi:hypothetical protein